MSCFFFGLGEEATVNGYATLNDDKAYASFALFITIIYFIMTYLLFKHRNELIKDSDDQDYVATRFALHSSLHLFMIRSSRLALLPFFVMLMIYVFFFFSTFINNISIITNIYTY